MCVQMTVDSIPHEIDTTDPELLAKWLTEIFGRIQQITPATLIQFQAWPSVLYGQDGQPAIDWITDSRILRRRLPILSPRDFVTQLSTQVDEMEALHA